MATIDWRDIKAVQWKWDDNERNMGYIAQEMFPAIPETPSFAMNQSNDITMYASGDEMLRISKDGFYVRGVRIEQDAKEAEEVYSAFKEWLAWSTLNR